LEGYRVELMWLVTVAALLLIVGSIWVLIGEVRQLGTRIEAILEVGSMAHSLDEETVATRLDSLLSAPASLDLQEDHTLGGFARNVANDLRIIKRRLYHLRSLALSMRTIEARLVAESTEDADEPGAEIDRGARLPVDRLASLRRLEQELPLSEELERERDWLIELVREQALEADEDDFENALGWYGVQDQRGT
jgi:hypothetical protein